MTEPFIARFGVRNNGHYCLSWNGPGEVPSQLLGLTDRPPGSIVPNDSWWPSVGCAPLGHWWVIWWTVPDLDAPRPGMVSSIAALWPRQDVGAIEDIAAYIVQISGGQPLLSPSAAHIAQVVNKLLDPTRRRPVVVLGLTEWPGLLAAIWRGLWPVARSSFSARVALTPPSEDDLSLLPVIIGIPEAMIPQADRFGISSINAQSTPVGRGERWLVGDRDPLLQRIVSECPLTVSDLSCLRGRARAADRLEDLRTLPTAKTAMEALKTFIAISPLARQAIEMKQEILGHLIRELPGAPVEIIRGLANIPIEAIASGDGLISAVARWAEGHLHDEPESVSLMSRDAEPWWTEALFGAVGTAWSGLESSHSQWASATLRWLCNPRILSVLGNRIPSAAWVESRLVNAAVSCEMESKDWTALGEEAERRGWSTLHAIALFRALPEGDAIRQQLTFVGDSGPGLVWLASHVSGAAMVELALEDPTEPIISLAAKRSKEDTTLLIGLNPRLEPWRLLWNAHLDLGGDAWPLAIDRLATCQVLADLLVEGTAGIELISKLASEVAPVIAEHDQRTTIIHRLSALSVGVKDRVFWLISQHILRNWHRIEQVELRRSPELTIAIATYLNSSRSMAGIGISPQMAIDLTSWPNISDTELLRLVQANPSDTWNAENATALGKTIRQHNRPPLAQAIADLMCQGALHFQPAVEEIRLLLSSIMILRVAAAQNRHSDVTENDKIGAVADIGAILAPNRLDHIWEIVGGKRRHLPRASNPGDQWRLAAQAAHRGQLRYGLFSLTYALLQDFPQNRELIEIQKLLEQLR